MRCVDFLAQLDFQPAEKAFHWRIIPTLAAAAHPAGQPCLPQERLLVTTGLLAALVAMLQHASTWSLVLKPMAQGRQHQRSLQGRLHRPAHNPAWKAVQNDGELQPPCFGQDICDIRQPAGIGGCGGDVALQDTATTALAQEPRPTPEGREALYVRLTSERHALGVQYAQVKKHPCQALAKRLLRHEDELFTFVLVEGVGADNNLAERSLRPVVVMRKISGGTRSPAVSQTRMTLASLFGTWQARGRNPFEECLKLLSQATGPSPAESSLSQV